MIASSAEDHLGSVRLSPEAIAHMLASAVRGFKRTATKATELRQLIKQLLVLALG